MASIPIEKEVVEELITFKLNRIDTLIQDILKRWNEDSTTVFIEKARNGTYQNTENDAIELRQLLLEEKKHQNLLKKIK